MRLSGYASELLCKLRKFRKNRTLCDTLLTTCDGELWTHSIVLAAASEQMCNNFLTCSDVTRSHYKVNLPKCDSLSVEIVIRYLYTGRIVLPIFYQGSTLLSEILVVCATLGMDMAKMNRVTVSFIKNFKDLEKFSRIKWLSIIAVDHTDSDSIQSRAVEDCIKSEPSNDTVECVDLLKHDILSSQNSNKVQPILIEAKVELSTLDHSENEDESIAIESSEKQKSSRRKKNITTRRFLRDRKTIKYNIANSKYSKTDSGLSCAKCGEMFGSKLKLRRHDIKVHNNGIEYSFPCEYCGKTLQNDRNLQNHLMRHTEKKSFLCDNCGRGFIIKSSLDEHVRLQHTDVRTFKCKYCQKDFISRHLKVQHQKTHLKEYLFTCETCGRSFQRETSLNRHNVRHSGVKPYVCPTCMRSFTQKSSLVGHMAMIHSAQEIYFICPICGKNLSNRSNLTKHISTHSTIPKTHTCTFPLCNKAFKCADYLLRHMKRHSEGSYTCHDCGRAYLTESLLRFHARSHVKFTCEVCEKVLSGKRGLNDHQKKVHGIDKTNVCMTCGERFSDTRLLLKHRNTHRIYT